MTDYSGTEGGVALLQDLIRCPSVTPAEAGAITLLEKTLSAHGFECHRLVFSDDGTPDVVNLYARIGRGAPHFCFAGHVDVVPTGPLDAWRFDPFCGDIIDGDICGRGAADMKSGVAGSVAATLDYLKSHKPAGTISFLITGDEEGPAINGTTKMIDWLEARGEKIDFCLLAEPSSEKLLGDTMKVGRRGSLSGYLSVSGVQGHVAYPHLADNPVPRLLALLQLLDGLVLDQGTALFDPSNLEIVNIDIGNKTENMIPAAARATFNVRFNDTYTGKTLEKKLRDAMDATGIAYELSTAISGESFYTEPGAQSALIAASVSKITGRTPKISTGGGTSDARFIRRHCPVIEFGLLNETIHKANERVAEKDMRDLVRIYRDLLENFFK